MGITDSIPEKNFYGFRIYKLFEEGPLHKAGLKELEDFIIPPEEFSHDEYELREYLKKSLEKVIDLRIFNLRTKNFFTVRVTPSNHWKNSESKGCLGAFVCFENFINAQNNLIRVVKVIENSLSEKIGLIPFEDYIVGVKPKNDKIFTLNSSEGSDPIVLFTNVLKSNIKKEIELFVYNSQNGAKTIKVNLTPKNNEIFGCDIIYGDGHEFPSDEKKPVKDDNPSEIDLSKSMAYSKNMYFIKNNFKNSTNNNNDLHSNSDSNKILTSKYLSLKNERSFASSINFSRSLINSNELNQTRTISPISSSRLSNNDNDFRTLSPLSLSKLSNENENENIIIVNHKDYEENI